jgi:hypothetical protein
MAEGVAVVGLLASIVQLITFGDKVFHRLKDFETATKGVPDSLRLIRTQLPLFLATLRNVESQIKSGLIKHGVEESLKAVVDNSLNQVQALETILDKVLPSGKPGPFRKQLQALRSLSYDEKVAKSLSQLQSNIQLIVFHQSTHQIDAGAESLRELSHLRSIGDLQSEKAPSVVNTDATKSSSYYCIHDGITTTSASFEAATSEIFSRIVRQQIKTIIPEAMRTLQSQLEPKYQAWFEQQLPMVAARLEDFYRESDEQLAKDIPTQGADGFPDGFVDLNYAPEQQKACRKDSEKPRVHDIDEKEIRQPTESHLPQFQSLPGRMTARPEYSRKPSPLVSKAIKYWTFGSLHMKFTKWTKRSSGVKTSFEIQVVFRPAQALLKRGFHFTYFQQTDCRGYPVVSPTLSSFAIVPNDSPVFKFAAEGDLHGLQSLFRDRLASPSDQTTYGKDLFQVWFDLLLESSQLSDDESQFAAEHGQASVCQYLITEGVGPVDEPR